MEWEDKLARDIEKLDAAGTNFGGVQKIQLAKTDALVNELFSDIEKLEAQIQEMQDLESSYDRCVFFRDRIKDTMDALRSGGGQSRNNRFAQGMAHTHLCGHTVLRIKTFCPDARKRTFFAL